MKKFLGALLLLLVSPPARPFEMALLKIVIAALGVKVGVDVGQQITE